APAKATIRTSNRIAPATSTARRWRRMGGRASAAASAASSASSRRSLFRLLIGRRVCGLGGIFEVEQFFQRVQVSDLRRMALGLAQDANRIVQHLVDDAAGQLF